MANAQLPPSVRPATHVRNNYAFYPDLNQPPPDRVPVDNPYAKTVDRPRSGKAPYKTADTEAQPETTEADAPSEG